MPLTNTQKGTDDARRLVQDTLGSDNELTDWAWKLIVLTRFDGENPTREDMGRGELQKTVAVARELLRRSTDGSQRAHSRRLTSRHSGLEGWQRRALLESETVANAARQRGDVQAVRRLIPGWPLSARDATSFLAIKRPPALPPKLIVCGSNLTGESHVIVRHGRIARLAQQLAADCNWTDDQAAWFIVTDLVPLRWPLSITRDLAHPDRAWTIRVAPWVPVRAIARALQRAKNRVECGKPRPRQRLSERASELLQFMATQDVTQPRRVLCRAWNSQAPARWRYPHDDPRHFWRDYQRAQTRLANGLLTDSGKPAGTRRDGRNGKR